MMCYLCYSSFWIWFYIWKCWILIVVIFFWTLKFLFGFLPISLIISHYAIIFQMWHYQIWHTLFMSHFLLKRMVWCYRGWSVLRAGLHGVPSLNTEAKSQLSSLQKPLKYGWLSLRSDLEYFVWKHLWDLCWELGPAFCSNQLSTRVSSLTSKKCCHAGIISYLGDLGFRTWDPW